MTSLSRCKGLTQRKTRCKKNRLAGLIYCNFHFHETDNYNDYLIPISRLRRENSDCLNIFPEEIWTSIVSYTDIKTLG